MFQNINKLVDKIKKSEKGQGMVEYALIIAFVAAIAIFALNNGLKESVKSAFTNASSMVNSAQGVVNADSTTGGATPVVTPETPVNPG